ncbi:MAG: ATP-binding protein [Planctomycetota bacterium]
MSEPEDRSGLQRRFLREKQRVAILERVIEDKTRELFRANEALTQQNQTLEELVDLRTGELRDALVQANAANQAKSDFLAQMSHELRTPLHGLSGTIDVLGRTGLDDRQRELITWCQQSSTRLLRVIGDVLDWTRIESGKLELEARPLCLQDLVLATMQSHAAVAQQKGVTLRVDMAVAPRHLVYGDVHRLGQVLGNLLGNALKFTTEGEVAIVVRCTPLPDGLCVVEWRVTDTGCGIPPAAMQRLFQPFSQAEAATTRRFGGSGLGLSISKRIVEAMGGTIVVQSTVGVGSTFYLATRHKVAEQLEAAPPVESGEALRGQRVLLVDDHPVNRAIGEAMLGELGCSVLTAQDGAEAIAMVRKHGPDLVLMDCHMPLMTGMQATQEIRGNGYRGPILAVSADVSTENHQAIRACGMQDLLGKPFRREDLVRAMLGVSLGSVGASPRAPGPASLPVGAGPGEPLVFDEAAALALFGGDRGMLVQMGELWLENLAANAAAVRQALDGVEAAALQMAAHAMRGSAASVGAARLRAFATNLERAGRAGELRPELRGEFDQIVAATEAAVRAFVANG